MDPTTNWDNWLAGQSYLETSYQNAGNPSSSARGYFQFIDPTARRAIAAGLPDPRTGGYGDQANAAKAYIQHFHPEAAAAIERGDFSTATSLLRGEWPSLPGGSQQQNPNRYGTWSQILGGQGPRPDASLAQSPAADLQSAAIAPTSAAAPAPQPAAASGSENPLAGLSTALLSQGEQPQEQPPQIPQQQMPSTAMRLRNVLNKIYGTQQALPSPVSQRLIDVIGSIS